ncbi:MAG: hypothetical protein QXO71_10065 [Candidatus Jordarchaeaceae archaeon]
MPKVKVDIFIPLSACSCQFSAFMDRVFSVLTKYRDQVEFDIKDSASEEARELKLGSKGIVINGITKFSEYFKPASLEKAIEDAIKA